MKQLRWLLLLLLLAHEGRGVEAQKPATTPETPTEVYEFDEEDLLKASPGTEPQKENSHSVPPEVYMEPPPSVAPPAPSVSATTEASVPLKGLGMGKVISLAARVDAAYTGGGAVAQGFSIPSLRISAYGEAGHYIDYRVSVAQTREFSSALLAQLLPSEAYIDLATNPVRNGERRKGADIRLRMGLYAPLFNPWWTNDLSDLNLPDYHEIHKANFYFRELGAEVAFRPAGENLVISAGVLNGSGITSLNTNNSKAFTGHLHWLLNPDGMKLGLGAGSFYMEQSTKGSINYKKNWISDFFFYFALEQARLAFTFDTFISNYEDTTRSISPTGYAATVSLGLNDWLGGFSRYESSTNSPQKGAIRAFQVGPMVTLSDYAKAFLIYQQLESSGSEERSIFLRVRVSI